jgi:tRNA(fMet)-specific endonuclease VapC
MKYMLDTNICSYIIKNKPLEVLKKFNSLTTDQCCLSSITVSELKYWAARNKYLHEKSGNDGNPRINEMIINDFIMRLEIMEFDNFAAEVYGNIRLALEVKGVLVGSADLFIGSHAISLGAILVTNNSKDFDQFPGIQLENWVAAH